MANDPKRKFRELGDIEAIMELYKNKLDWKRIKGYFKLFEMDDEFKVLSKRFKGYG